MADLSDAQETAIEAKCRQYTHRARVTVLTCTAPLPRGIRGLGDSFEREADESTVFLLDVRAGYAFGIYTFLHTMTH